MVTQTKARLVGKELQLEHSSEQQALYFHGLSMLPFLQEGDLVVVKPIAWDDIKRGDIITYRNDDKFPTRRVLFKQAAQLSVRCDGWPRYADNVAVEDVLGRAEARCRNGRWITPSNFEWQLAKLRAVGRALAREGGLELRKKLKATERGLKQVLRSGQS